MIEALGSAREALPVTDLSALDSVQLMRRFDTKYVVPESWLPDLLDRMAEHVSILVVNGVRESVYENLYFELPGDPFLSDHLRGRARRMKIRQRHYSSNGQTFLEVKQRFPGGRTVKERAQMAQPHSGTWTGEDLAFLDRHMENPARLEAKLTGSFRRMTLVDFNRSERVTIDRHLNTGLFGRDAVPMLPGLAVIEVKQPRPDHQSPVQSWLRGLRGQGILARRTRMSKYAIGRLQCEPDIPARMYLAAHRRLKEASSLALDLQAPYST